MGKGAAYERKLVRELNNTGYPTLRIPASGRSTKRDLPDIFTKVNGGLVAIELKFTSSEYALFQSDEIEALQRFSADWDATPLAVGRFSGDTTHYALPLYGDRYNAELTNSGNLSIKKKRRDSYHELYQFLKILERATK